MKTGDFTTHAMQASVWTAEYEVTVRELVMLAAGPWAGRFDGEPVVLPKAAELPPEIPRFGVVSRDDVWKIQVSSNRADIFWQLNSIDQPVVEDSEFSRVAVEALAPLISQNAAIRVSRLAFIVKRVWAVDEPGALLARHFCRDSLLAGPLNRPKEFQLHAHKVYRPDGFVDVNSWIRWKTALREPEHVPCVSLEQDLNTLGEEEPRAAFTPAMVAEFFMRTPIEARAVLDLYLRGA